MRRWRNLVLESSLRRKNRHRNEQYLKRCQDWPEKFKYKCHPKDISLRHFISHFAKDWEPLMHTTFVPVIIPLFRYPVASNHKKFPQYCKSVLLAEKPGCYPENLGQGFENMQDELTLQHLLIILVT